MVGEFVWNIRKRSEQVVCDWQIRNGWNRNKYERYSKISIQRGLGRNRNHLCLSLQEISNTVVDDVRNWCNCPRCNFALFRFQKKKQCRNPLERSGQTTIRLHVSKYGTPLQGEIVILWIWWSNVHVVSDIVLSMLTGVLWSQLFKGISNKNYCLRCEVAWHHDLTCFEFNTGVTATTELILL